MTIIEIAALENGAHRNQSFHGVLPDGWAMIPDGMDIPETFPFVDITVDGDVVTSMTAGIVPGAKPVEEVPSRLDALEAQVVYTAMMTDTLVER